MKHFLRSRLFLVGLLIKLLCLPLAGSTFLNELFIPFVDQAVRFPTVNPWSVLEGHYFPYGSVLLAILFVPKWIAYQLFGDAALGLTPLSFSLMKLPLLVVDIAFLLLLARFVPRHKNRLLFFYWLNPILIYISYIHGQLDIVSMFFAFAAIYLLIRERIELAATSFALAVLCKFHVIIFVPFLMAYIWNRRFASQASRQIIRFGAIAGLLTAAGFAPLVFADKFLYASAGSPEAFRLFGAQIPLGGDHALLIGISLVLAVLGRLCASSRISENGLVYGCGMVLGTLLVVTSPAPGWYFWVLPFFALFYSLYHAAPRPLFALLVVSYLCYFVYFVDVQNDTQSLFAKVAFTVMQTSLGATLFALWLLVIRNEAPLVGRVRPLMIGIAGDSGTGKNVMTSALSDLFTPGLTVVLEGDDYHKWERGHGKWQDYTHLNPKANFLSSLMEHARDLTLGRPVFQPHYDHSTGHFTEPREIRPSKTIIIQGLHTFYARRMRESLDLKIFLAPDERVRLAWKIARDVNQRNQSLETVLRNIEKRIDDSRIHILPQSEHADWIIQVSPEDNNITREQIIAGTMPSLMLKYALWNDAPIDELVDAIHKFPNCEIRYETCPQNFDRIEISIRGNLSAAQVEQVAATVFPNLRNLTRGRRPPKWESGFAGMNQLFAVALLGKASR